AFVVILAPIVGKFGLGGLLVAGMLAGLMLVGMAAAKLGRLITFIPHPVTTGFTAGIAVVIGTIQLKDFLGLSFDHAPEGYVDRWKTMWHARATASGWEIAIGSRFHSMVNGHEVAGIPPLPPLPLLPWHMPGANGGAMHLDWATIQALF